MALKKHNPGCNCCDNCTHCGGGATISVTIDLIEDDNCSDCADFNATFICDLIDDGAVSGDCVWLWEASPFSCALVSEEIRVTLNQSGGDYMWAVNLSIDNDLFAWRENIGSGTPDCSAQQSVSFSAAQTTLGSNWCGYSTDPTCQLN